MNQSDARISPKGKRAKKAGRRETVAGLVILAFLTAIAAGVFLKQFRYDPAIFTAAAPEAVTGAETPAATASELEGLLPEGVRALSPIETFTSETLSDKIDGKAELYLSSGFVGLRCQRFVEEGGADSWMEVFVYDMGDMRNAFSVYSAQKRTDAEKLDLARFAYRTANALYFVHGKEYVEVVAASATPHVGEKMLAFGRNFVAMVPALAEVEQDGRVADEFALFPPENLDAGSIALLSSDVFGFERLNNVLIAGYTIGGRPLTAFISDRGAPREAAELAEAYHKFLLENGGTDINAPAGIANQENREQTQGREVQGTAIPGAVFVQVFDTVEVIFTRGALLAGVHEADDAAAAAELALMLHRGLSEVGK